MLPLVAALGGATIGAISQYFGQSSANSQNQQNAREQMAFQERMSSTQYQRATEDMRKAGLNPLMAASISGASTPAGAMGTAQNTMANAASDYAGTAKAVSMEAQLLKSQIALNQAAADRERTTSFLNQANAAVSQVTAKLGAADLPRANAAANVYDSWIGKHIISPMNSIASSVGSIFGGANSAKALFSKKK